MRKSYLMIAAAATILASCSNEKVLNDIQTNDQQTAIGFGAFTIKPTRALTGYDLEDYHKTFMVYSTKYSILEEPADTQYVFGEAAAAAAVEGTKCYYVDNNNLFYESNWKYDILKFWDKQAKYDFIAYSPEAAPLKYQYIRTDASVKAKGNVFVTTSAYTLYGQNLQDVVNADGEHASEKLVGFTESDATNEKDIDILTSDLVKDQLGSEYINNNTKKHVELQFHHILAKLNVLIAKDSILNNSVVTIKSVRIDSLKHVGTYDGTKWTAQDRDANSTYALDFNQALTDTYFTTLENADVNGSTVTLKHKYFIESLVMPQTLPEICYLTIKYEIKTGDHIEQFTSRQDISDASIFTTFADRTNYTLKIKISPTVITFDANAADWDLTGEAGYTVY